MAMSSPWAVARQAAFDFIDDDALTLGAALAYYTALAMSPLVVLLLWLAAFAGPGIQEQLVTELTGLAGQAGGEAVRAVIENAKSNPGFGTAAGLVSLATLLFSVSGVFGQLQYALDEIFDVRAGEGPAGMRGWLRKRLLSLGTFLSVAFLLVVSLVASALVSAAAESSRDLLPGADVVWQAVAFGLSLLLTTLVFSLIFEVLPDVHLRWRDAVVGGVVTTVLFTIGRVLIGLYLGHASIGSAYGAAGSLVVLLVWVYYASLILFAGAEVTQVLARRRGGLEPEEHAVEVEERTVPVSR